MSETAVVFGNFASSWQMPAKSGGRKYRGPGKATTSARSAAMDPPSGDVTPDNDGEDGTHDDTGSDSEIREAGPREATSSTPRFSHDKVELLRRRSRCCVTGWRQFDSKAAVHLTVASDLLGSLSRFGVCPLTPLP